MQMPNEVALDLTFAEAAALFEIANLGLARKTELTLPVNGQVLSALM